MSFPIPEATFQKDLLRFRFSVLFFVFGSFPNPLDIRFQKVSGFKTELKTPSQPEGGQNMGFPLFMKPADPGRLVLERGMVVGSLLSAQVLESLSLFRFRATNVLVTLLDERMLPISAWQFMDVFPVSWTTSDLQATNKDLMIETIELSYRRMQVLRL